MPNSFPVLFCKTTMICFILMRFFLLHWSCMSDGSVALVFPCRAALLGASNSGQEAPSHPLLALFTEDGSFIEYQGRQVYI